MTVDKRIAAGSAFLDSHPKVPAVWRQIIDTDTLDIGSRCECVVAHLFGTYSAGYHMLELDNKQAYDYGFFSGEDGSLRDDLLLTEAWKLALRRV